jgi:hypothetical protein
VWCPLGDFFGTAPGENRYTSLATGMTENGHYSYWYMPFAKSAVLDLVSEDQMEREMQVEVVHAPLPRPFAGLGYFHAKWHRNTATLSKDRWPDWEMLQANGRGRFCGVMLHVWSPRGTWWGEGDEKFFVDGEKFPSTFGTGSEDYFGYAWGDPALFAKPYHGQTMSQNNRGHQSVFRWQIPDNVPFQRSFEACIEKYDHPGPDVQYACVPVWYLSPDGTDPYGSVPKTERDGYYAMKSLVVAGIEIVGKMDGVAFTQTGSDRWVNGDQLCWTCIAPGGKLNLRVPVKSSGAYRLNLALTKAPDYVKVQFHLDGKKIGEAVDCYHSGGVVVVPCSLGIHSLEAGDHTLTVEVVDINRNVAKSDVFGLDTITCELDRRLQDAF